MLLGASVRHPVFLELILRTLDNFRYQSRVKTISRSHGQANLLDLRMQEVLALYFIYVSHIYIIRHVVEVLGHLTITVQ